MTQPLLIDQWGNKLRQIPQIEALRTPGMSRSYPMLAYVDQRVYLSYFFHPAHLVEATTMHFAPPISVGFVALDTFELDTLDDATTFFKVAPFEPHEWVVAEQDKEQRRQYVQQLKALYPDLVALYPHQPAGEVGKQFAQLLMTIVPPALYPYYQGISAHFWAWLTA